MKFVYPEGYNDEDKMVYDDLISRGRQLIGVKLRECDDFLLDLSAKITINNWRGYKNDFSDDQIKLMKQMHKDTSELGVVETKILEEIADEKNDDDNDVEIINTKINDVLNI